MANRQLIYIYMSLRGNINYKEMRENKDPQNQIVKKLFLDAVLRGWALTTPLLNIIFKGNFKISLLQGQSD